MHIQKLQQFAQAKSTKEGLSINVLTLTAVVIAFFLLLIVVWVKLDYGRHKRPLQEIDPNVRYTFWHHIKVVTIPLLSYRITFMIQKKK